MAARLCYAGRRRGTAVTMGRNMAVLSSIRQGPKSKIVGTLGPATEAEEAIAALVESGMTVARLNLSHGSLDWHTLAIGRVRRVSERLGVPVGIMADVPGPKYRTGPIAAGAVELKRGARVRLTSEEVPGSPERIGVLPPGIHRDAAVGEVVLVDDGLVKLQVLEVHEQDALCEVVTGGRVTERRSVVIPGKTPSLPFPDQQAINALRFAAREEVDFVALSNVTHPGDIEAARAVLAETGPEPLIISKIEMAEALDNFEGILAASDAIMVARGDLGVELPLARVPVIQKRLISRCNVAGKPVITATQMLESMVRSPVPTRAEVTDVANAIFDGTDAIMLSAETSVGQHPAEAVQVMAEVAREAEAALPYEAMQVEKRRYAEHQIDDAIAYDACQTAFQLNASLIVAFTESGSTAGRVSKYRPQTPILALTPDQRIQRRLTLRWGVTPLIIQELTTVEDFFACGESQAVEMAGLGPGSLVVLVAGLPIGVSGGTNLLRVLTIPDRETGVGG